MTSFSELKVYFSRKQQDSSAPNFFQDLKENSCPLQVALKSTAPGL